MLSVPFENRTVYNKHITHYLSFNDDGSALSRKIEIVIYRTHLVETKHGVLLSKNNNRCYVFGG